MTVRLEGNIKRFIGLSTDPKPVPGYQIDGSTLAVSDLPAGSSFLETDTGLIYRWDGTAAWTVYHPAEEQGEYLQAVISELASLRELLAEALA